MIRTDSISSKQACLMAVAALDEWVCEVVKNSGFKTSAAFFDWIAEEGTALVEMNVAQSFHNGRFAQSLYAGDARIALSRWVTQWVAPKIALKFEHLAPHLPAFAASSEADVQALLHEGGYENARAFWPGERLACLRPHPPLGKLPVAGAA